MTVTFFPVELIDPPDPVLRFFSETEVSFLELVDQIKQHNGSLNAPPARPRQNGRVQLIDGYRRYRAHIAAEVEKMPLRIVDLNDTEYMAAQINCNSQHKDTSWVDFAIHLERLRKHTNEDMSLKELARICKKSTSWIKKILKLNKLSQPVKDRLQRSEITLGNAHWLARLPFSEQPRYVNDALKMSSGKFEEKMKRVINDYREKVRQGKLDVFGVDDLLPQMRDLMTIESELENPTHLPLLLASNSIESPMEAALLALKWAFRVDDESIEERKQKMLNHEREKINDAKRRKFERENMKLV